MQIEPRDGVAQSRLVTSGSWQMVSLTLDRASTLTHGYDTYYGIPIHKEEQAIMQFSLIHFFCSSAGSELIPL
jgi:hypothetical protein